MPSRSIVQPPVLGVQVGHLAPLPRGFFDGESGRSDPLPGAAAYTHEEFEHAAGRRFTSEEVEVAWAASMYPAAHNARGEVLFESPRVAAVALRAQAEERLRRGGA